MRIMTVLPTRGLIHSKTVQGLISNIAGVSGLVIVSEERMPDCFNMGVEQALDEGATHIWMVEEDNELPDGVLEAMINEDKPIVTCDYPVAKGVSQVHTQHGYTWCGVGNTLIKSEVFEAVGSPWFEVDKHINQNGDVLEVKNVDKSWGGHDAFFFYKAFQKGFEVSVLEGWRGEHYRVKEVPKLETNKGYYTVTSL